MSADPWVAVVQHSWIDALVYSPLQKASRSPAWNVFDRPTIVTIVGEECNIGVSARIHRSSGEPLVVCTLGKVGPGSDTPSSLPLHQCLEKARYRLDPRLGNVNDYLCRVCNAFSDAVCIVSPNVDEAAQTFVNWIESCQRTIVGLDLPLAVVMVDSSPSDGDLLVQFHLACENSFAGPAHRFQESIHDCFRDLIVMYSPGTTALRACSRLTEQLQLSRRRRESTKHLWGWETLEVLFEKACESFASRPLEPFDFVVALRANALPSLPLPGSRLADVLHQRSSERTWSGFVVPAIAKALLHDASKVECHRKYPFLGRGTGELIGHQNSRPTACSNLCTPKFVGRQFTRWLPRPNEVIFSRRRRPWT
jgi:hypothetical protein